MYVEYSARVFKKYSSHNVSHSAQVYNLLYTYCGGCAGFLSKDSLYSLYIYIVCIDYIDYKKIYIYIWAYFKIVFSLRRDIFHGFLPINTFP